MELFSSLPISMLFAFIAFVSSWAVSKHKISSLEKQVDRQNKEIETLKALRAEDKDTFFKTREKDDKATNDKFAEVDFKREKLKDDLTRHFHTMDKKITEIHTIVTQLNTNN